MTHIERSISALPRRVTRAGGGRSITFTALQRRVTDPPPRHSSYRGAAGRCERSTSLLVASSQLPRLADSSPLAGASLPLSGKGLGLYPSAADCKHITIYPARDCKTGTAALDQRRAA